MDDILKRLGALETSVATITATLPHLATKADFNGVASKADLKDFATKSDLSSVRAFVEVAIIKWIVGTGVALIGAMFAIVRFAG